jgi:VIT1/CCC1 family predicted Fe2+/Mn2+ transporter
MQHNHAHKSHRLSWLRAAVLGANDGIISTSSLIIGVSAANASPGSVLLAGVAGLTAGALSMASGEYVSVSSQSDVENAEIALEKKHLKEHPDFEKDELAQIYVKRGVSPELAQQVADQLMEHDALGAHLKDELGLTEHRANPLQAALTSALTFTLGGLIPVLAFYFSPAAISNKVVFSSTLFSLLLLGILSARAGGANVLTACVRIVFWGALAMGLTFLIGRAFE